MTRLSVRLFVILLALVATGTLGYRAFQADLGIGASLDATRRSEQAVSSARITLAGLEATMRALVAPGQRPRTWSETAERQLDQLRELLMALEGPAPIAGEHPLDGALDSVDQLSAGVNRVRGYMDDNQPLLASDVVFNDIRETIASLDQQVGRAGTLERGRQGAALSSLRQEQGLLVGGIVAAWLFAAILLLPTGRQSPAAGAAGSSVARAQSADPLDDVPDLPPAYARGTLGDLNSRSEAPWAAAPAAPEAPGAPVAPEAPATVSAVTLTNAASLCTDLGKVTDSREISTLLARASGVLDASGLIVWVAGPSGMELFPVASHGYDARVFARIGSVQRDSANLTAAAFREAHLRTVPSAGSSCAAMAAPLIGPAGPVGVLSAELNDQAALSPEGTALATILAAQLATLVGSMPAASADAPPAQQANA